MIFARLFAQIVKLRAWFQTIKVDNVDWFSRKCVPPIIAEPLIMRTNLRKRKFYFNVATFVCIKPTRFPYIVGSGSGTK